jgi:hypothetical protein
VVLGQTLRAPPATLARAQPYRGNAGRPGPNANNTKCQKHQTPKNTTPTCTNMHQTPHPVQRPPWGCADFESHVPQMGFITCHTVTEFWHSANQTNKPQCGPGRQHCPINRAQGSRLQIQQPVGGQDQLLVQNSQDGDPANLCSHKYQ